MLLPSLRVVHLAKLTRTDTVAFEEAAARARLEFVFHLDTCQRELWILPEDALPPLPNSIEVLSGLEAYRFLLRVATGLESQVQGETDIFGQLKSAWSRFEETGSPWAKELGPWIQKLFEDTKEIRSRFLRNIGGESYGSLVRKSLRAHDASLPAQTDASVLMVGAGNLAQAVAPWLVDYRILIANRTRSASEALRAEILARSPHARVEILADIAAEQAAWAKVRHAVVCIPLDANRDAARLQAWNAGPSDGSLIHLGTLRAGAGEWTKGRGFCCLDDLFPLQQDLGAHRLSQLERAAKACDEKAVLRSLLGSPAGSATLPHGWEDLALFG